MRCVKSAVFFMAAFLLFFPLRVAGADGAVPASVRSAPGDAVCLTVDDGFNGQALQAQLDLFREKGVRCTFFVVGCQLAKFPDQWRKAVADGHEICYHTMFHRDVGSMSDRRILEDVQAWNDAAREVLGEDYEIPKFARLPFGRGSGNKRVLKLFDSLGYTVVCWNCDTLTGAIRRNVPIRKYIMNKVKPGSIILTHAITADARAMEQYIDWLAQNFRLVTVGEAFAPPPEASPPPFSGAWIPPGYRGEYPPYAPVPFAAG